MWGNLQGVFQQKVKQKFATDNNFIIGVLVKKEIPYILLSFVNKIRKKSNTTANCENGWIKLSTYRKKGVNRMRKL